jgi:hypothetical protein
LIAEGSVDTEHLEKKFNLQLKPFYDSAVLDSDETFSIGMLRFFCEEKQ